LSTVVGAVTNQLTLQVPCDALWRWVNNQGFIRFYVLATISDGMRSYTQFRNSYMYTSYKTQPNAAVTMTPADAKSCVENYFGSSKLFASVSTIRGPPPANLATCLRNYKMMFGYNFS
jgi:hypothetical protein